MYLFICPVQHWADSPSLLNCDVADAIHGSLLLSRKQYYLLYHTKCHPISIILVLPALFVPSGIQLLSGGHSREYEGCSLQQPTSNTLVSFYQYLRYCDKKYSIVDKVGITFGQGHFGFCGTGFNKDSLIYLILICRIDLVSSRIDSTVNWALLIFTGLQF